MLLARIYAAFPLTCPFCWVETRSMPKCKIARLYNGEWFIWQLRYSCAKPERPLSDIRANAECPKLADSAN
jgi:hypothetical protein